jgi:hypothetical protein
MSDQVQQSEIESQLRRLETDLLRPEVRRSPQVLLSLLAEEFCEFGSSGRIYTRQEIIDYLQTELPIRFSVADFSVATVTEGVALVRYQAVRYKEPSKPDAKSLRSSLWVLRDGRWQMIFHQGTKISE